MIGASDSARIRMAHTPSEAHNAAYAGDFDTPPEPREARGADLAGEDPGGPRMSGRRRCVLCGERRERLHPDRTWLRVCTECRDWLAAKDADKRAREAADRARRERAAAVR